MLRNLIDNARSFSPPGGAVTLSLGRGPEGEAQVLVEDEGPGVPCENLENIFERFYTQRPRSGGAQRSSFGGHSGLGLSIARQIIEVHGGRIRAENRTGDQGETLGARFVIDLPPAA